MEEEGDSKGWVPLSALQVLSAPLTAAPPPAADVAAAHPQVMCSICLDPLSSHDHLWSLPCAHTFHVSCVGKWLSEKSECPLCRCPADGAHTQGRLPAQPGARASLRHRAANAVAGVARRRRRSRRRDG